MNPEKNIVLVTGAAGRIGDAVMRRLTGRFSDLVGFDRKAPTPPPPGCVYIAVDVTSDDSMREGLRVLREHHSTRAGRVLRSSHCATCNTPANRNRTRTTRLV